MTFPFIRSIRLAVLGSVMPLALAMMPNPIAAQAPAAGSVAPSRSTWPMTTTNAQDGGHRFVRSLRGTFNGQPIAYEAVLEDTILMDRYGTPATRIFTTSFIAKGSVGQADRPVMFIFNGGPGAASNTLMFGAFGPRRMARFDGPAQADPATGLTDNPDTVLDVADLVFIDAPETGYGRPLPGADPQTFRSNDGDSFAFAQAILHWLDRNKRTASPVYLAGESYGSLRAVMLARDLRAANPGISVAGLILISQAILYNGPASMGVRRLSDPMRAINQLPGATAFAWYHGLIDNKAQTLQQAVDGARRFALSDYASALVRGNRLSADERGAIARQLERHTGLAASYFLANDLRFRNLRRDLLASRGLALAEFDARETEPLDGIVPDENRDWDKAMLGVTTAMQRYVAETFGARTVNTGGLPAYRSIVPDPYGFEDTWTYIKPPNPALDVVLEEQLQADPKLRVMVPQGIFDTTSAMGSTEAVFSQMPSAPGRVMLTYYAGGHMLYSDDAGRKAFTSDVRAFVSGGSITGRPFPDPQPGATHGAAR